MTGALFTTRNTRKSPTIDLVNKTSIDNPVDPTAGNQVEIEIIMMLDILFQYVDDL